MEWSALHYCCLRTGKLDWLHTIYKAIRTYLIESFIIVKVFIWSIFMILLPGSRWSTVWVKGWQKRDEALRVTHDIDSNVADTTNSQQVSHRIPLRTESWVRLTAEATCGSREILHNGKCGDKNRMWCILFVRTNSYKYMFTFYWNSTLLL